MVFQMRPNVTIHYDSMRVTQHQEHKFILLIIHYTNFGKCSAGKIPNLVNHGITQFVTLHSPLVTHSVTLHSSLVTYSVTLHSSLVTYSVTLHSSLVTHSFTLHSSLVTYSVTLHSSLVTYSVTLHSSLMNAVIRNGLRLSLTRMQNTLVQPLLITWIGVNTSLKSLPKQTRHLVSFTGTWLLHLC